MINATIWQRQLFFFFFFGVFPVPYFHTQGNTKAPLKSPNSGGRLEAVC